VQVAISPLSTQPSFYPIFWLIVNGNCSENPSESLLKIQANASKAELVFQSLFLEYLELPFLF
jgi:hypothetical protein